LVTVASSGGQSAALIAAGGFTGAALTITILSRRAPAADPAEHVETEMVST
jgi:hypothetical protein